MVESIPFTGASLDNLILLAQRALVSVTIDKLKEMSSREAVIGLGSGRFILSTAEEATHYAVEEQNGEKIYVFLTKLIFNFNNIGK